jgi:hypothetical protein
MPSTITLDVVVPGMRNGLADTHSRGARLSFIASIAEAGGKWNDHPSNVAAMSEGP